MTKDSQNTPQPLESIGPMPGSGQGGGDDISDPAKLDYKKGREHAAQEKWSEAAICFHNALKGFEEQDDQQGIANASDRLGDVCMAREDYAKALEHFQRARQVCQALEDAFSINALNKKMVVCLRRMGDLDRAIDTALDIFDHYGRVRDPQGTVRILEVMSELYQEKGDTGRAVDCLRTISSIHRNFKHKRQAEEFEKRAADLERGGA